MAPSATETNAPSEIKPVHVTKGPSKGLATLGHAGSAVPTDESLPEVLTDHREPLKLSGALDGFKHFESTPVIGREYVDANLAEILRAPNSDELIRDLAITSKCHSVRDSTRPA